MPSVFFEDAAGTLNHTIVGEYVHRPGKDMEGRPTYQRKGQKHFLFFKSGEWFAGPKLGNTAGFFNAEDPAMKPEEVGVWLTSGADGFGPNPHLRCVGAEQFKKETRARLEGAAATVALQGGRGPEMGTYTRRAELNLGRHTYAKKEPNGKEFFLFFAGDGWYVSDQLGESTDQIPTVLGCMLLGTHYLVWFCWLAVRLSATCEPRMGFCPRARAKFDGGLGMCQVRVALWLLLRRLPRDAAAGALEPAEHRVPRLPPHREQGQLRLGAGRVPRLALRHAAGLGAGRRLRGLPRKEGAE
jgi:hypothetical protein